ncbi:winged helix-turn-helix domain-containing protein [Ferrimonas lipolytica]|uniref:Helix-turn-helix domain-containing protein n=1 Tax=Ferrimonas lipolytica TaxID=2724191 RepID=A0A6H1UIE6_9GAMM|nr:helix-turn-helix domain-containing protein [Ferrimonas lipolytica]QIZ78598.1 helix-turn-helix domain-containing protein [Ferrimonas lipolytica]
MSSIYRLGQYCYDIGRGELFHPEIDKFWHLPRVEKQVLEHLIAAQGSALSKQQLRRDGDNQLAFSDSAAVKAIFTLRHFIDDDSHDVIQTIATKGYSLALTAPSTTILPSTLSTISQHSKRVAIGAALLSCLVILAYLLVPQSAQPAAAVELREESQFILDNGQQIKVISVANSNANRIDLAANRNKLAQQLAGCKSTSWQRAYMALSHDGMVLNITLLADSEKTVKRRNIKISDFRLNTDFLPSQWVTEANLCE